MEFSNGPRLKNDKIGRWLFCSVGEVPHLNRKDRALPYSGNVQGPANYPAEDKKNTAVQEQDTGNEPTAEK